jgi:hypothetical protein
VKSLGYDYFALKNIVEYESGPGCSKQDKLLTFFFIFNILYFCKMNDGSLISDICILPKAAGPCNMNINRWYYDYFTGKCREFEYSGCHGNRNRFISEPECYHSCVLRNIPTPAPTTTTTLPTSTFGKCYLWMRHQHNFTRCSCVRLYTCTVHFT